MHAAGTTLVAVGVVDILPRCLSSVYLFWDPAFAGLALGKLSALKEIEWVAGAHRGTSSSSSSTTTTSTSSARSQGAVDDTRAESRGSVGAPPAQAGAGGCGGGGAVACPALRWYYMGFYIPTCHKMRYKGEYSPSDLLCPKRQVSKRICARVGGATWGG